MFNKIADNLSKLANDAISAAKGAVGLNTSDPIIPYNSIEEEFVKEFDDYSKKMWKINAQDWHKVMAYRFTVRAKDKMMHFTLPIPPQSYSARPIFPAQATATFGGVVEEVSSVKFWAIQLSGTFGTAISRSDADMVNRENQAETFREIMTTTGMLSGAFAQANKTVSKIGGVVDRIIDGVGNIRASAPSSPSDAIGAALGTVTGAYNDALLPSLPFSNSAVSEQRNGFSETEEFVRFLQMYHALKAKYPDDYSLYFSDYKTDKVWRVVVKEFTPQKSADSPNLYRYSLSMQGWDVQSVNSFYGEGKRDSGVYDRFGQGGDLKDVNVLNMGNPVDAIKSIGKLF